MSVERVTRLDDRRLEEYRNIRDPELLRHRGLYMAEGRLVVERLLDLADRGHRVKSLLLNDASFAGLEQRLSQQADVPVYVCSNGLLASIVGFNLHRGCLALAERPPDRAAADVVKDAEVLVVLEGVADPDNVGAVFRNADAFGAGGVLLNAACCDPLYRKAIRTSMASTLRVPYARLPIWPSDLAALKTEGFTLMALTPGDQAIDLASCAQRQAGQKVALLVGNEGSGLTPDASAMADVRVRIPMRPGVDSLNLATATGIALYHLSV
jgi:tRNA G18 (ribose-2'-O)-methylase SpoU